MKYARLALYVALATIALGGCDSAPGSDPGDEQPPTETLRSYAAERGLYIGAAVATGLQASDTAYARILRSEFNMLVAENAMKFGPLRPTRTTFNFAQADALLSFAEAHRMEVRGHALVWHNQNPAWLSNTAWTRDQLLDILRHHIHTVVGRYKGRIGEWDVVNEAIGDNGQLRDNVWRQRIGDDYIARAFEFAHEADPDALLFYNDYSAEGLGGKSDAVFNLVQGLRRSGVPIHGVGLQMHVSTTYAPPTADVAANMRRLGELGLNVNITEMDVRVPMPPASDAFVRQADVYEDMLGVCLAAPNCTSFVLWGFTDRFSWIPQTFPGTGAALLFDEAYAPKPAYTRLLNALRAAR